MRYRNIHIAVLAFFLLLIFVAPFIIKAGHHHTYDPLSFSSKPPGLELTKENRCIICNFEFVTFNVPNLSSFFCFQHAFADDFEVADEKVFRNLLTYFSLRAPPKF